MSKYDELEKLNSLKEQGAISADEYEREKERILAGQIGEGSFQPWGMGVPTYCMLLHLSQLISLFLPPGGWVAPIILWAAFKDQDARIDGHGKVVLNWILSALIYSVAFALMIFIVIGIPLLIALHVAGFIFAVIGGVKANDGQIWNYPLSIRFFETDEETPA